MIRLLLLLVLLLPAAAHADARLTIDLPDAQTDIVVSGRNATSAPLAVTLRIDDRPSPDYANRVNEERTLPPGPFSFRVRLGSLVTPRGRKLDRATAWRAIAFAPDGGIDFAPLRLEAPPPLPDGLHGWYFGPDWSVPLAGLIPVQPDNPGVSGPHVDSVNRPGTDPVLGRGMHLTRFVTSLPPGKWHVTLWTEDPGAWETLPPVIEQRIRLNGRDIFTVRRSFADWVDQRYFAGRAREADPGRPPFDSLGAWRGGRISGTATVGADQQFMLEMAGFPQAATHIAMMIAAPEGGDDGVAAVENIRAIRFAETWPVLVPPPPLPTPGLPAPEPAVTVRGGHAILRIQATVAITAIATASLEWDGPSLPARILWGQWRWRRPGANAAGLAFSATHLRADTEIPLRPDLARPLVVIADGATAGQYRGHLRLRWPGGELSAPFSIQVLDIIPPASGAQVAAFLDFAPHLLGDPAWDRAPARKLARAQAACDLATLRDLGLAPLMPPVGRIDEDLPGAVADLQAAAALGPGPIIAYAPLRALPAAEAARMIARAEAAANAAGLTDIAWSLADEPAYNGTFADAAATAQRIHAIAPGARFAGHFNDKRDAALLPALSIVTVNPGYGADASDITALRAAHVRPFLYNMPSPRLAAGAYLWRSGADGLIQWHARMPTADAFDPTDGREGDVQFLWPTPGICAEPDFDADLLSLVEGAEDLKWFAWLNAATPRDPRAAQLRRRLWDSIPSRWGNAERVATNAALWRDEIIALARTVAVDWHGN